MRAYSMRCMTLHLRAVNRNNMPRMRLAILPARLGDSESVNSGPGPSRSSALHKALSLPLSTYFLSSVLPRFSLLYSSWALRLGEESEARSLGGEA